MNHSEKQLLARTSPMVIDHISSMLQPLPELSVGYHTLTIEPKSLSYREYQLFWRYHDHFSMEFIKALVDSLPDQYNFISYDHLNNKLKIEVI